MPLQESKFFGIESDKRGPDSSSARSWPSAGRLPRSLAHGSHFGSAASDDELCVGWRRICQNGNDEKKSHADAGEATDH